MAEYRPGTEAAAWIQTVYSKKIHINAYNRSLIGKNFLDLNGESQSDKPGQTFNWFTHANLARTSLSSTSSLTGLTFLANTEVAISGTASAFVVPVQVNQLTLNRMMMDPRETLKQSIEFSLAEGVDAQCATLAASNIANVVGSGAATIDKSLISQAIAKGIVGAKMYWKDEKFFYYHPNQQTYVQNVVDWTASYARGDNEKPNVDGFVNRASGLTFVTSPVVYSTGGIMYNFIQTKMSHGLGFNQRTNVTVQPFDLVFKLIGITDFMAMILKDAYGVVVQTSV